MEKKVHEICHRFGRLSCGAQIDLIYHHLNIVLKYHIDFFPSQTMFIPFVHDAFELSS